MSHQHPLIALPRKTTTETDFATPLRHAIAHTYGERPDTYAQELALLARCRADAVAGAGSDTTARDLLFKYFGQLELLELRFAQQKISFDWHDAFTGKSTQQTSLAFEKASVLHLLASHLSSHAAAQPRIGNPEGIKRAYTALRQAAGLLTFIHENFLHAPSTDLSREVLTFCASLMTLQAAQVFLERCIAERKPPSLTSRMCQALVVGYTALVEDSAQFQGKGILDRAWLDVITIRAKYYASLGAWYRATHEQARGDYGNATSRFGIAHGLAQEAQRLAKEFTYSFIPSINSAVAQANSYYPATPTAPGPPPTLPADAATCLLEITQAHLATALESKTTAERDNDLIYHALPIPAASLPAIDPLPLNTLASPITIQEIYAQPEVTALIGPDIFRRLVPLEVHEQASVYSEEKAKLVRGEVERCDVAEGEVGAALNELEPRARIARVRALGASNASGVPAEVERWAEQISQREQAGGVEQMLRRLDDARRGCERLVEQLGRDLDDESRECERMRVKYSHRWSQQPSGTYTRALRGDLKARAESLTAAAENDARLASLWRSIAGDVGMLSGPDHRRALERAFAQQGAHVDLLDVDVESAALNAEEQRTVDELTDEVETNMKRLDAVRNEQAEVLKDLKQKVQADDVSNLLLLNRGRTQESGPDPTLFATELEKFKPYQARLAAAIQAQKDVLEDVAQALRRLESVPGVKRLIREQSGEQNRTRDIEARFRNAWEGYEDVRVGVDKGLHFYDSMNTLLDSLRRNVRAFITQRTDERNRLVADAETRERLAGSTTSPPPRQNLEDQLAGLRVSAGSASPHPSYSASRSSMSPPPVSPYATSPPPVSSYERSLSHLPPPPPRPGNAPAPTQQPYDFSSFGSTGTPSAFAAYPASPPPPPPPSSNGYASGTQHQSMPAPPSQPSYQSYNTPTSPYPPPPPARPSAYPPPPPGQHPAAQSYYPAPPAPYPGYQQQGAPPPWNQQQGYGGQPYR